MPKKAVILPLTPGSRRTYLIRRDKIDTAALSPAEVDNQLAIAMACDMGDIIAARGNATCTKDDLVRLGWSRADVELLGEAAGNHLRAGPDADALRALERIAA